MNRTVTDLEKNKEFPWELTSNDARFNIFLDKKNR